jgi:hypothetical protein
MSKAQLAFYVVLALIAYCEQEGIPVIAFAWYHASRFWYGLAEFAGSQGIKAELNYTKEMGNNG